MAEQIRRQPSRKNPRKHRHYGKLNLQSSAPAIRGVGTKVLDFAFPIYLYGPSLKKGTLPTFVASSSREGVHPNRHSLNEE
jgi:hypothetical protein